jgi:hypothetical protein
MYLIRLIFVGLLFTLNITFSATYYVDNKDGDDNKSGLSVSSAWKTLHKVNIYLFKSGDTVSIKANTRYMITEPLASKSNITFNSYGSGARPVIDGGSDCNCINYDHAENIKFINLKFVNGFPCNITLWKCDNILIESCNIDSSKGGNIHNCNVYSGQGSYLTIRNSTLNYSEQTMKSGNLGVYIDGTENSLLEYDTLFGNLSNIRIGFGNEPDYGYTNNLIIRYCVVKYGKYDNIDDDGSRNAHFFYNIFESDTGAGYHDNVYIFSDGSGNFNQYSAIGSQYYNNTFITHTTGCTFEIRSGVVASNIILKNNIFYNTNHSGWMFYSDNTYGEWTFNNNIYYSNRGVYNHYWHINSSTMPNFRSWTALGYDSNSICANPMFTDYTVGDFTLQSGSPARNAGAYLGLSTDIQGNPIPVNFPDIGAFQYLTTQ